ncbi:hypothetical protein [Nocardioides psychrotolerans]|uniref:hypothetical protein n=1 Tax=Nocardioides psychrotolerans TaxID=1005945 RepID=UPI0031377A93
MTARPLLPRLLTTLLTIALLGLVAPAATALAPLAPGGVTGRVLAPGGAPQAGLAVRLLDLRNLRRSVTTRTGADGRFSFTGEERPGLFAVLVCEAGDPCKAAPEAKRTVMLHVGPAGTAYSLPALTRYFETTETSPAVAVGTIRTVRPATAVVTVRNGSLGGEVNVSGQRATVRNGIATVRGLAPGRHLATNHGQRKVFTVGAGRTARLTFGVRLATVTGRVVTLGRPDAQVPVSLQAGAEAPQATLTDAQGRYSFRLLLADPDLTYRLRVGLLGLGLARGVPKAYKRFTLSPGEVRRVDVVAPRGSRGSIDVTIDGSATPKRPAAVALLSPTGSFIGRDQIDVDSGRIDGLTPGTYQVYAQWKAPRQSNLPVNAWRTVTVRRGTATPALMTGRSGSGSITVTADPGNELMISSRAEVVDAQDPQADDYALVRYHVLRDRDTFTFRSLPDGTYDVGPRTDTNVAAAPEPVTVEVSGGEVLVDLDAQPRQGSLRGRLVDPATGDPWPWTGEVVRMVTCSSSRDSDSEYFLEPQVDLEIRMLNLIGGDYGCRVSGVRNDPGTPYLVDLPDSLTMRGTVRVTPGQESVVDFPVPFAAVS